MLLPAKRRAEYIDYETATRNGGRDAAYDPLTNSAYASLHRNGHIATWRQAPKNGCKRHATVASGGLHLAKVEIEIEIEHLARLGYAGQADDPKSLGSAITFFLADAVLNAIDEI
jgi:hypothetical protein